MLGCRPQVAVQPLRQLLHQYPFCLKSERRNSTCLQPVFNSASFLTILAVNAFDRAWRRAPVFRGLYAEKKVIAEERRLRVEDAPLGR